MSCNPNNPGSTHHTGCACWEARRDAELAQAVNERDAARALAGRLRRATLDALLPVDSPAWGHRPEADAVLRRLAGAAKAVPAEWEPKP